MACAMAFVRAELALGRRACKSAKMSILPDPASSSRPPQLGGGCLIAAGLIIGPIVGIFFGEITLGLVAGGIIGAVAAVVMALRDRN